VTRWPDRRQPPCCPKQLVLTRSTSKKPITEHVFSLYFTRTPGYQRLRTERRSYRTVPYRNFEPWPALSHPTPPTLRHPSPHVRSSRVRNRFISNLEPSWLVTEIRTINNLNKFPWGGTRPLHLQDPDVKLFLALLAVDSCNGVSCSI
jgi:hypothetical protein